MILFVDGNNNDDDNRNGITLYTCTWGKNKRKTHKVELRRRYTDIDAAVKMSFGWERSIIIILYYVCSPKRGLKELKPLL